VQIHAITAARLSVAIALAALNNAAMNARNLTSIHGLVALLAIPLNAYCADQTHRCASVGDDAQRLSCYDAAFGKPGRVAEAPAPPAAARPPAPMAAPAVATVPGDARTAAAEKQRKRDAKKAREAASKPVAVTAAVAAVRRTRDGRIEATLQNGAVWTQIEPDSLIEVREGDTVTIRPALLGSFLLVTKSGTTTRVRRTK
jgi:hypothetical protein